jgi:serine/threonine protein kinase/outer membrane protein assembly factor BamB
MVEVRRDGDPPYVGPFRVLARLGRGGFGTVYACAHGRSGELAAVKVVHPHLADSVEFLSRFAGEVAAIKRVRSDFVPRLIDEKSTDEPAWLATELIPGRSLDRVVKQCGPLPETAVWCLGAGIAEALAAIHGAQLVHRDLKPHNVLLVPDRPWIIDFGLAHLSDLPHQSSSRLPMATYQYAAPEQLKIGLLGAGVAADIFALGATLLFAATGHPPHEADSQEQLFVRASNGQPNLAGLPGPLYGLVESCLLRSPEARPSLTELRAELARHAGDGDGFAAVLPRDVLTLLDDYREELAEKIEARGPARLGWKVLPEAEAGAGPVAVPRLPEMGSLADPATLGWTPIESYSPPVTHTRQDRPRTQPTTTLRDWPFPDRPDDQDDDPSVVNIATVAMEEPPADLDRDARRPASQVRWTTRFDSWICAPASVHGDVCVAVCLDGTVAGLRLSDGRPLWRPVRVGAAINDAAAVVPRGSGADGDVFVGAADGSVHAIDLATGRDRTVLEPGAAIEGPPVAVGQRVYVLRTDGSLHAIDARTGERKLIIRLDGGASGPLAATARIVFAADITGSVHVIDAVTGRDLRQVRTAGRVIGTPVPVAGRLFVTSTDGRLRSTAIEDGYEYAPVDLGDAPVHTAPVHSAGVLYIGGSDGLVHAYDIDWHGGHGPVRRWPPCALGDEIVGLAAADGLVYVAVGYRLVELDGATGELRRELLRLNCLVGAAPVIWGRFGYVVGLGGVVKCLALR